MYCKFFMQVRYSEKNSKLEKSRPIILTLLSSNVKKNWRFFRRKNWPSQNTWTLLTSKLSDHFSNWLAFSLYSRSIIMKERRKKKKKQYCVRKPSEELISVIRQRRTASQPTVRQPASQPGSASWEEMSWHSTENWEDERKISLWPPCFTTEL